MANGEGFQTLQIQTLFLLWSVIVVNGLEVVLYMTHVIEMYGGFWIRFGVVFHILWSICAMSASILGVYGIEKHIPELLTHTTVYFLCSAALKAIFSVVLFFFPASDSELGTCITYASSGPLLLTFIERFFKDYQALPIALAHVITIAFLLFVAFLAKRYQNAVLKRDISVRASELGRVRIRMR